MNTVECRQTGDKIPFMRAVKLEDNSYISNNLYKEVSYSLQEGLFTYKEVEDYLLQKEYYNNSINSYILLLRKLSLLKDININTIIKEFIQKEEEYSNNIFKATRKTISREKYLELIKYISGEFIPKEVNDISLGDTNGQELIKVRKLLMRGMFCDTTHKNIHQVSGTKK